MLLKKVLKLIDVNTEESCQERASLLIPIVLQVKLENPWAMQS
jgi:hypothetical protein